ncbi:MAG: bile acid:sodium symporter family protein [Bacteroidota bacterium]
MTDIDAIQINFNQDQVALLNVLLAFIMFGVALDIRIDDFRALLKERKKPLIGLTSEYLLLPLLTMLLIFILQPGPSLSLGMILIAVCPGGSTSNFMVHLAKGNSALSVMLTSITTIGAIVITPLAFTFWASWVPGVQSLMSNISVNPVEMILLIIQLILIPVALGMFINHRFPKTTKIIERPISWLSMLIFLGFVFFAVAGNYENIKNYLHMVFLIVLLHNGLSLATGYLFARSFKLPVKDCKSISIETGIQNSGLGLALVFNFFNGLGGMAMILAWWGVWHLVTGFGLAFYWRLKENRREAAGAAS